MQESQEERQLLQSLEEQEELCNTLVTTWAMSYFKQTYRQSLHLHQEKEQTEETEEDGSHLDCLQTDGRLRLSPSSHVPSNTCNTRPSQSRVQ